MRQAPGWQTGTALRWNVTDEAIAVSTIRARRAKPQESRHFAIDAPTHPISETCRKSC
jgi:hypothetical protein